MQLVANEGGGLSAVRRREGGRRGLTPRVPLYPKRKCTIRGPFVITFPTL